MIQSTTLGKGLGVAGLLTLAVVGITLTLLLSAQGGEPLPPVALEGVPPEEFENIVLNSVSPEEHPSITSGAAVDKASTIYPGAAVRQTVLVHLTSIAGTPPIDRLAWAVNFDPSTVAGSPPFGPEAPEGPHQTFYAYAFIDAQTGI